MVYTVTNDPAPIDWCAKGQERTLRTVANLLGAWRGECPFYRDLGLSPDILHAPQSQVEALVVAEVHRNIWAYAPDANVLQVRAWQAEDGLHIEADVEVEAS